jgi:beta-xylosidase/AraC-like DNA-binding protein
MAVRTGLDEIEDAGAWLCHPSEPLTYALGDMVIIFVLDGELEISKDRDIRKLRKGGIILINPPSTGYERAFVRQAGMHPLNDCYFLLLKISISFLSTVFKGNIPVFDCDSGSRPGDYNGLQAILAEIASLDTVEKQKGLMFYSRLYRLLEELKSHFIARKTEASDGTGKDAKRRELIYSYIQKHFRETISLDDVANILSFTPQYLSKYFKRIFGITFYTYIKRLRLEAALKELSGTNKSVTAISYDNGFPNLEALIQEMKDTVGQTPSAYRKAHQIESRENDGSPEESFQTINSELVRDKLSPFIATDENARNKPKRISANAQGGDPFEKPWQEVINLGFATDFEKSEFIKQITLLQTEAPFRYARFQGLFGRSMLLLNGSTEYSFVKIDRVIDFLYSVHLLPFIEIGFKPAKINKDKNTLVFSKDDEIDFFPIVEYEKIIDSFLKHAINRYGMEEVSSWQFEYWEPRNDSQLLIDENINTYIDQFTSIRATIKKMVPAARVGGPGLPITKPVDIGYISKLTEGLSARNSLPDFFSYYLFHFTGQEEPVETEWRQENLILFAKNEINEKIGEIKKITEYYTVSRNSELNLHFTSGPFYITEWNFGFSCRSHIHDSLFKAPFIIKNSIDVINNIDVLAYWLASDISAEYADSDAPLFGGPGLISRNGIRKPAFFAYQFLSKLGGRLLSKGDGHIITAKSDDEFVIILFNYKYITSRIRFMEQLWYVSGNLADYLEDAEKCSFSAEIRNIKSGRYKIRQHILNSYYGSVYDTWMGLSAVQNLQNSETEWLERACFPHLRIDFLTAKGSLVIDCELEPNEVRLLEINRILE